MDFIQQTFDSISDCLNFLKTTFPQEEILIDAKDISSDKRIKINTPRFLFRGESKIYPSTFAQIERVQQRFPEKIKNEIESVVEKLDSDLRDWLKLDSFSCGGYLQHYGLPTGLIDISPSIETATFFASHFYEDIKFEKGLFCVFDNAFIHKTSIVIDLSNHPLALRPRLQDAYVFWNKRHLNIKSQECISDLGLKWYAFNSSKEEKKKYYDKLKYLPNNLDDITAGFIFLCLLKMGFKVSDITANYIVNECQIPGVPIVMDIKTGIAKTFKESGIKYSEEVGRYNLYRVLSNQFPDTFENMKGLNPYE